MHLTEEQSNYLRILGHTLTPVIDVGPGGVTESLRKELDKALSDHELVKVRVRFGDKNRRARIFAELAPMAEACLVKDAGYVALLYRPNNPSSIRLPQS
jgi:RNA-binding protein